MKQEKKTVVRTGHDLVNLIKGKSNSHELSNNGSTSPVIERLHGIWRGLLSGSTFSSTDDFFQVGGNSLKAVQLASRISSQFNIDAELTDIFLHPTIKQQASLISSKSLVENTDNEIQPQIKGDHIPLSFNQEQMWLVDRLEGSIQYHLPVVLRVKGNLDIDALEKSFKTIIRRHEILRTIIYDDYGKPYQQIRRESSLKLKVMDRPDSGNDTYDLKPIIANLVNTPFDLSKDDMLRATLISLAENEYLLVAVLHHIASDGWSTSIIVKEMAELYDAFVHDRESNLKELSVQYADYSIWQRNRISQHVLTDLINYWKTKLEGVSPIELPIDFPRPAFQSTRGAVSEYYFDKKLHNQLIDLGRKQGATLFMTLLSAFKILLYNYSRQTDLCIGTSIAGRKQQELEDLIGYFVNTIAIRTEIDPDSTFNEFLSQIKQNALEAYEHQEAPFERVVDAVIKERDKSRSSIFQVLFTLQNTLEVPVFQLSDLELIKEDHDHDTTQFELGLSMTETNKGLKASMEYCTDLFKGESIDKLVGHYQQILKSIVQNPEQQVGTISMLSSDEKIQLVNHFNPQSKSSPKSNIKEAFEEQVLNFPDHIAVVVGESSLTFGELNNLSNKVAHYLRNSGYGKASRIPICTEPSIEMLIGIMGIIKAGAAYIPLDPHYPSDRLKFILKDVEAKIILCSKTCKARLNEITDIEILELDPDTPGISGQPDQNTNIKIDQTDLCYIIFTSGSTGIPKGVMIGHGNIYQYLTNSKTNYINKKGQATGSFAHLSPTFDASLTALFMPLLSGKAVVFSDKNGIDVFEDSNLWKYAPYDFIKITPSHLALLHPKMVNGEGRYLTRKLVVGGEALRPAQLSPFYEEGLQVEIINEYGPTEASVGCTVYSFNTSDDFEKINEVIPIGIPIENAQIYIVNDQLSLLPVGITGEICIGGNGVSRGYLNREALTSEKFIDDPFNDNGKIYRTGDLGRWLPDGNLEFLGRIDDQVKIRGHRVELGEIEKALESYLLIKEAIVLIKEQSDGSNTPVAYVVSDGDFETEEVINYLSQKIPEYMIPALWVTVESIPLTSNGKVDKKALKKLGGSSNVSSGAGEPTSDLEKKLTIIWQNLLEIDKVGVDQDFFNLGGHSLLAIRLVSTIRKELNIEVPINGIFENSTISKLAGYCEGQINKGTLPEIKKQERPERIPLSYSQERLWFVDKLQGSVQYHLPATIRLKGNIDMEALENSFKTIINRHEVLRTVFLEEDGNTYQKIKEGDKWQFTKSKREICTGDLNDLHANILKFINTPFDLSKDYMLRASLCTLKDQDHLLVVAIHHIASDGWSMEIVLKEVVELYESYKQKRQPDLPALPLQYADYAIWQRQYLSEEMLRGKLGYWKEKLKGVEPLQLPLNNKRPDVQSTLGNTKQFTIDAELTEKLKVLSQKEGATLFMVLLSALKVLLYRYCGQQDICIGSPVANRNQQSLDSLVGFFVNMLPLRTLVNGELSFTQFLRDVKQTSIEAFEYQDVPFEKIVDAVVTERQMSRSPLFQVAFALQNKAEALEMNIGDLRMITEEFSQSTSKFDLTFYLRESEDGLKGILEYSSDLFFESTADLMILHFLELLSSVVNNPSNTIGELPMLSKNEQIQMLDAFNDNKVNYKKSDTLITLFEKQVIKTPNTVAVEFENKRYTYQELNARANQLGHYLREKGIKEETLVPICLDRSLEMMVGLLGILKAGGAYVPIDPEYPQERINYIIKDTGAAVALGTITTRNRLLKTPDINVISVDENGSVVSGYPVGNVQNNLLPQNLAYVIYTSGSTGFPKGVMNEHGGVVNRLRWAQGYFNLTERDTVLQKTTFCFDVSVWELFWPLLTGSKLVFAKPGGHKDAVYLKEIIESSNITMLHFVPSMLGVFLSDLQPGDCGRLQKVLCSGEALKKSQVELFMEKLPAAELHNLYGPTEAAIDVTCWSLPKDVVEINLVPIGKPIANTSIYLLDAKDHLVPFGGIGEINIGGIQVARGYLNRPELTSEKFVNDPFNKELGSKMYKTGDLGRWLPDGSIEYLGRIDEQVKIRGFRIELGEIEACMSSLPEIINTKVTVNENNSLVGTQLNAYVEIDKEKLPLLNSYLHLLNNKHVQKTDLHILPNGLPVLSSNANEVKFLYKEIFKEASYLKYGIALDQDSCVFDVGANVGFFTLFLNILSQDITVYSFEPIPEVYDFLSANRELYNIKGKAFDVALLDKEQQIELEYYPQMTILSGIGEDKKNVKEVVRSYVESSEEEVLGEEEMNALLEMKLESRKVKCKSKTLSQIISEEKIDKIDLLKVDVENSEHLVIGGIREHDWDKIENIVIEVHDVDGRLGEIKEMLERKGFEVHAEKENLLSKDDILYNIYAVRNRRKKGLRELGSREEARKKEWKAPQEIITEIKNNVEKILPDYMVPASIFLMDRLPLTPNGKIDKKALPEIKIDKSGLSDYEAPQTEVQKALVRIWQDLLKKERIGIHDNFFEMGGDSIVTIQVVSRARKAGYVLEPRDTFLNQTIAGLSVCLDKKMESAQLPVGEQGFLSGPAELSPIQQMFFEKDLVAKAHFNQVILLGIDKSVSAQELSGALEKLMDFHDVLRFSYSKADGEWQQSYGSYQGKINNEDLRELSAERLGAAIEDIGNKYQRSLDIESGELLRAVWLQMPSSEKGNRLMLVIHHLAVDGVSWRILLEDLERLLTSIREGTPADLGAKGSSYRQWYEALQLYSNSKRLLSQRSYWDKAVASQYRLPVDREYGDVVKEKETGRYKVRLDPVQTRRLLQEVPKVYHTEINDLLLSALAQTLSDWSESKEVVIGLEGHGREDTGEGLDISRTVGWFTSIYPVKLEVASGPDRLIKTVKEQMRKVPDKGLGYGVLKYINKDEKLRGKDKWEIVFNYFGQTDNAIEEGSWLSVAQEAAGRNISEENGTEEKLSVNGGIRSGELELNWTYSRRHYEEETIVRVAGSYIKNLEGLISHCAEQSKKGSVYTPSDYGLSADISYEELDTFLQETLKGQGGAENLAGIYRLNSLQQGMLFHRLYDEKGSAHMNQCVCDLIDADLNIFAQSWDYVLKRHSILRSSIFHNVFSIPVQCIFKDVQMPLEVIDYRHMGKCEQEEAFKKYQEESSKASFDFKIAPLMKIGMLRLSDHVHRMVWTWHHIVFDGWSMPILMEEFLNFYESLSSGNPVAIGKVDNYGDYVRFIENRDQSGDIGYWRNYLAGVNQPTMLPFIRQGTGRNRGVGEYRSETIEFDETVTSKIYAFTKRNRLTANTLMQGVWSLLLHKYTGNEHVTYGVTVSGRPQAILDIERRVGMFINTTPLHSIFKEDVAIGDWLMQIQEDQLEGREYQYTSLNDIQKNTGVEGDLFDTLMTFENFPVNEMIQSRDWKLKTENVQITAKANYPLTLLIGGSKILNLDLSYNSSYLAPIYARNIIRHFERVLLQVVETPEAKLGEITVLSELETEELLDKFNPSFKSNPIEKTVIDLFEARVPEAYNKVALIFKDQELSYQQLNEKSNQVAHYLISKGIGKGSLVPVCIEPSAEMVIGIMGVLKAGGAYVPIDAAYPQDRTDYIIGNSGARLVLCSESNERLFISEDVEAIILDDDNPSLVLQSRINPPAAAGAGDLAYIIYTSGSTGRPKGVMIEHGSLVNYLQNSKTGYIDIGQEGTGSYMHLSYTFDASLTAMFMPLISGKKIVIGSGGSLSAFEDPNFVKNAPYDFIKLTPSHLGMLERPGEEVMKSGWLTGKLVVGGEALRLSHIEYLIESGVDVEVINEYGPTEATVGCSTYSLRTVEAEVEELKNGIPIGRPMDNVQMYIVNEANELVPVGVAGEICIAGSGVARGYLHLEELTEKKFIKNPYAKEAGARMYKTGDVGRWLPDGNIEYLGRKDDQVKIRGYRVELGEIENVMEQHEDIREAVVLAPEDSNGTKRLIGYVVTEKGFDQEALKEYLGSRLPEYMIPALWVELESMPLTPNGKVDKKALPDPQIQKSGGEEDQGARNELETTLVRIWQELLDLDDIGIHDNFFELGGDSIISIQVVSRARKAGYELQVSDIFSHQTIAKLAEISGQRITNSSSNGEQDMLSGPVGLLPIQQWYFSREMINFSLFNQAILLELDKTVTGSELSTVLNKLMGFHDALRFRYSKATEGWQQAYGIYEGKIDNEDLRTLSTEKLAPAIEEIGHTYQGSLDIEAGELVRAVWIQTPLSEKRNRLLLVIHHLAVDGVSWRILLEDLERLLTSLRAGTSAELGAKGSSYRQWYEALRAYANSQRLLSQRSYWQKTTQSQARLPVDREYEGVVKVKETGRYHVKLDALQTRRLLQEVPKVYHTEINDLLVSALARTLSEWSDHKEVLIGLEGHGRQDIGERIDTNRTVGWFTSVYPVLLEVPAGPDRLIKTVKEQLRKVPDKGLGYGVLKYVNKEEILHGKDKWEIVFNYLGQMDNAIQEGSWLSVAKEAAGRSISEENGTEEKLAVNGGIRSGELELNWTYSRRHYDEETIVRIAGAYIKHLEDLIRHCAEQSKQGSVYTPSDYGLNADISYEELDAFMQEDNKDDIMIF